MKRALIVVAATVALLAGCQQEESRPSMSGQRDSATATSATAAKPAQAKGYYELDKNGKTYVFGDVDALLAFRKTGTLPAGSVEKSGLGPGGETVVFQGGGLEKGLMTEYQKSHPKK
jgi:hypothetical protein